MVPLWPRQPKQPLLQDRVLPIPQGQGKAETALPVGDAQEAVLSPAVGTRASMVMREILPTVREGGGGREGGRGREEEEGKGGGRERGREGERERWKGTTQ